MIIFAEAIYTLYVQRNNIKAFFVKGCAATQPNYSCPAKLTPDCSRIASSCEAHFLPFLPLHSRVYRSVGKFLNDIPGKISGLPEGLVTQVGVTLGHPWTFVSQELLQGIEVHLAGGGQHRGVDMAQAMEGPEVSGQACRLFD
jgi:hypothetical protein